MWLTEIKLLNRELTRKKIDKKSFKIPPLAEEEESEKCLKVGGYRRNLPFKVQFCLTKSISCEPCEKKSARHVNCKLRIFKLFSLA